MTKKHTNLTFIKKANIIHNNKYNYSKINYINNRTKIIINCKIHGDFNQSPDNHLRKKGCPTCGSIKTKTSQRKNTNNFIKESKLIHNNKYSYNKTNYINSLSSIIIICPTHGKFKQLPNNHLQGKGCSQCGGSNKKTLKEFINQANSIHNNKYNYSKSKYINSNTKTIIICKIHGKFHQTPAAHINQSQGCFKCCNWASQLESNWLDSINILPENRHKRIKIKNKLFIADGFNPNTNTIYEFYGDYWHGNPKVYKPNIINKTRNCTFGELYKNTINRELILKEAGYNLIIIWESDWNNK